MPATLLVTGAAGQLGQRVIAHLLESERVAPERIVAGTRNPDKLASLAAKGLQVRKIDFEDPGSLAAALEGIERMLLVSTDAIDRPGRRLEQHRAAVKAAQQAGVKHVVYTSMPKPENSLILFAPDHLGTEQALASSGLGWTILRNNWYMENLLRSLPPVLATGKWYTSAGNRRVAWIAREDCARAAAAALAAEGASNTRLDVTGPEALTTAQVASLVSSLTGRPIEVVQVNDEQLKQGLIAAGVPDFIAPLVVSIDANTRAGGLDVVSDTVQELTGRAPQNLRTFLADHKSALAGSGA